MSSPETPVLLLLSRGVTYADSAMARSLVAGWKDVEVETIDAHHWPLTERPNEVRQAIESWCRRFCERESSGRS